MRADQSVEFQVAMVPGESDQFCLLSAEAISDEERIEAALKQSEKHLGTMINSEPECVKLVSEEGILLEMNPAGLQMVEADSPEEVLGLEVSQLVDESDRDLFVDVNRRAFEGESGVAEFRPTGLKATQRWMEPHVSPLGGSDGEVVAALSVTRDITERKKSDDMLAKLLEGTAGSPGSDFFRGLTRAMAESSRIDYAFIGEIIEDSVSDGRDPARVRTICCWGGNDYVENFEYALPGTPCWNVWQGRLCHHESGVAALFPRDDMLGEMKVESYLGIPLISESGKVIGILVALDRKPMPHSDRMAVVFKIFAAPGRAELSRVLSC